MTPLSEQVAAVERYTGHDYVDGTSDRCEVINDYRPGDENNARVSVYVLYSDYVALLKAHEAVVAANLALREAIVDGCLEIEWYASRKKNLASPVDETGKRVTAKKLWADVLMEDIADLRKATRDYATPPPAALSHAEQLAAKKGE
jgi:hypothetical protein